MVDLRMEAPNVGLYIQVEPPALFLLDSRHTVSETPEQRGFGFLDEIRLNIEAWEQFDQFEIKEI